MRRRLLPPAAALVVAVGLLIPAPMANAMTALPLHTFSDVVVDDAHGRVFVSGGREAGQIVVTDLDGKNVTVIDNVGGASQMVLGSDGATLYAALASNDAVAAIDTTTLEVTKISTGPQTCPYDVAETAGRIWFSYGCSGGNIGTIDPVDNSVHLGLEPENNYGAPPLIEASPQLPERLVVLERQSPSRLSVLTATGGVTPSVTEGPSVGVDGGDLALTPDGSRVITTSMAPYVHPVYLTSDLSADGVYSTDAYPNSVAVRSDGMVAAGINGIYEPDIYLYAAGTKTLYRSYDFETYSTSPNLQDRGLAFGATRLYAVTGDNNGNLSLRVITPRRTSQVTITPSATTYRYGATARLTVHLKATSEARTVSVYATPYGGNEKLVKRAEVDSTGTLKASLPVQRRTTFTVRYAGDAVTDPASGTVTVAVRAKVETTIKRFYAKFGKYHLVHKGVAPISVGKVSPDHSGDCLRFRAQFWVDGAWRYPATTECVRMDRTSRAGARLTGDYPVGLKVRMRAEWRGDKENAASNAAWRYVKFTR